MKFIHAADIHLDSALRGLERYEGAPVEEIRSATRRAFDNLVQLAIDEQVAFVLLAGDLYDGDWKDYNTGLYLVGQMQRLHDASIPVFIVAGNHDAASQITKSLRLPDNVTLFSTRKPETVILDDVDVAIHGQGFSTRAVTEDLSRGYPQGDAQYFNIGLLHTSLDGKPGHEPYAPCSVDGLRSRGYDYWALGHVHQREVISKDPWIVFPGNVQGRHIRETGPKGCTLVSVDNGIVNSVEHVDLDVMRWTQCEVDISTSDSLDDLYEDVRTRLQQIVDEADGRSVAVRIVLLGKTPLHAQLHAGAERLKQEVRALCNGFGSAGMWLEKLSIKSAPAPGDDEAVSSDEALGGLLGVIRKLEVDDAAAASLLDEVAALGGKLPPELRSGDDGYDPADPQQLEDILEDVKELLVNRLLATEGGG
ncbi:MAG: DNA repair exonuclease [Gammaproteobacteria bacterium]|nr:DNA repair exonuclease [Gammaproteobacteria bacterium]